MTKYNASERTELYSLMICVTRCEFRAHANMSGLALPHLYKSKLVRASHFIRY